MKPQLDMKLIEMKLKQLCELKQLCGPEEFNPVFCEDCGNNVFFCVESNYRNHLVKVHGVLFEGEHK